MKKRLNTYSLLILMLLGFALLTGCTNTLTGTDQTVRIGILMIGDSRTAKIEGMKQGMKDLGWTGQQVEYVIYNAKEQQERLLAGAQSLIDQNLNVLVATGVVEAQFLVEAMRGKSTTPVVLLGVTSPVELELKKSFADAGIPVLGVDNGHVELTGKRMELLRLLFPERDRILVFYDPRLRASLLALQKARETAALHSWQIEPVPVSNDSDIQSLHTRSFGDKESILILSSYYLESKYREIRDLSFQKKVPVMGLYETEMLAGYTASYGISNYDQGNQSARLVIRALDRQNPGNLLFEMPDVVRLKLNMQAAAKLGVHFSPLGLTYGEKISEIRE